MRYYDKMSELYKIGKKSQIVIPKKIREKLKIHEGDKVFIDVVNNILIIMPVPKKIEDLAGIGKNLYKSNYVDKLRGEWD